MTLKDVALHVGTTAQRVRCFIERYKKGQENIVEGKVSKPMMKLDSIKK